MKSIKRRIVTICSAAFMLLNSTCLPASASTTDSVISGFGVQPSIGSWSTLSYTRQKDTDSSAYLYLTSAPHPVYVRVMQGSTNVTKNGNNDQVSYVTCSQGIEYRIKSGASVPSNITLSFKSSQQYSGFTISGYWSPDWKNVEGHTYRFAY